MKNLEELLKEKSLKREVEEQKYQEVSKKQVEIQKNEQKNQNLAQQKEYSSKLSMAALKFGVCLVIALFSINIGILHNDGGLFRGFFMQLIALGCSGGSIVFFVQIVYYLIKRSYY